MKPPKFEYHDPSSVEEALTLLERYQGEAKILAGGQSLIPLLNFRLTRPSALIDINRIGELDFINESNGKISFGALTRQRRIEFSSLVKERLPLWVEATKYVGHLPTRTRGTIGGSIAHADPAAEYPALIVALDGEVILASKRGRRLLRAEEFFVDLMTTAMEPDEMVVEVRVPVMPAGAVWGFEEFSRRHGDFAIVAIAAQLVIDERGQCVDARLAAAGAAPVPVRLKNTEEILKGSLLDKKTIDEAAQVGSQDVHPSSDIHASAEFRRHLTRVLIRRTLNKALARLKERGN